MLWQLVEAEINKARQYLHATMLCGGIFIVAAYAGYIAAVLAGDGVEKYYGVIIDFVLGGGELPDNLFLFILARNALVSFLVLALGIFTYSVWPVLVLAFNGAVSGFIVKLQSMLFQHNSYEIWLFGLLPHGVPELGALFLAAGATFYYRRLRGTGRFTWAGVMQTYFLLVLPLLLVAALIESFLTPLLIQRFLV